MGITLFMGGESTPSRSVVQSAGFAYRLSDGHLTMTQEFIGNMLGVRREGVTQAALRLRQLGVISYSRGMITVLDRAKLEALSCERYAVVKRETELLLNYLPQRQTITDPEVIPTATLKSP